MGALADSQHPWAFAFGILANLMSIMVYFAPVSQNAVLFITINTFGSVMLTFGNFVLISIFAAFDIIAIAQLSIHRMNFGCCDSAQNHSVCHVAQVIRTKTVEFMLFSLSFFLTLSGVLWFAYGLVVKDIFIAISYGLGFVLGLLKMLFYAIYKNRNEVIVDKEKKPPGPDHVTNAVILSTIATSKVHSVDAKPCDDNDVEGGKDGNKDSDSNEHKCMELVVNMDASGDVQLKSDEPCAV